jgi:adenosine/AMP kinase
VVAHPLARGDILLRETLQDQELSNTVRQEITRLQEGIHPVILPHPVAHTQEAVTVAAVVAVPAVVAEVIQAVVEEAAVIQAVVEGEVIQAEAEAEAEAGEGKTIILFICYKYCDHEKADSHFHLNRSYSCWVYPISNRCTQVFQDIL